MTDIEWEDVTVPQGTFVKWEQGHSETGWVVHYDPAKGGTTFDGDECGVLVLDDKDTRELRTITLDKGALRDAVAAANPRDGLLMQVACTGTKESKAGRTYLTFGTKVAPGVAAPERVVPADEEPF
jgi:hypothetical protein